MDTKLLETLCCPATKQPLRLLNSDELREINEAISRGERWHPSAEAVEHPLEGGLITSEGGTIYRLDKDVPILSPNAGIVAGQPGPAKAAKKRKLTNHWERHAVQWNSLGPPLRPAPDDIDVLRRLVAEGCNAAKGTGPRSLLLGVTPEIATMQWPDGTRLLAVDQCLGMIHNVWPSPADSAAICAVWKTLPLRDGMFDVVTGDGAFTLLDHPEADHVVVEELRRVLRDDGLFVARLFVRPEVPEPTGQVFDDLRAGRIGNFHAFKWRLAMSLHGDLATGVRLDDIWKAWNDAVPAPGELAKTLGWPLDVVRTIEAYRGVATRYTFPTLAESIEVFAPCFERMAVHVPDYELGDRCPTLAFRPVRRRADKRFASERKADGIMDSPAPLRTIAPQIVWPAMPGPRAANLLSVLYQFEASQWWTPDRLLDHQLRQLQIVLRHFNEHSAFCRKRWGEAGFDPAAPLTADRFSRLPILTRRDVQSAGESLFVRRLGPVHGPLSVTQTSGSTGQPVHVLKTALTLFLWAVLTLRAHQWHRRDATGKMAVIRAGLDTATDPPNGLTRPDWGAPLARVFQTGPFVALSIKADLGTQAAWLARHNPHYLLTYPSNLMALVTRIRKEGIVLSNLRQIQTISETVTPGLREACREMWNVPVVDVYSSQEVGYLALQCPECENFHVQSESVLVEILDNAGKPCSPGEIGRVVVTDLHNFAMPLIRYDIADYAEVGRPCPCGRGLPTLAHIVGRHRNMLTLPSGELRWPLTGFKRYREIAPVRQFQFVQNTREQIEVRFVVDRPLTSGEEDALKAVILERFGHPFELSFVYLDEIPRSASGKFEEFISKVGAP